MFRSGPDLADVFRQYGSAFRQAMAASLSLAQRRVMNAIATCRTAVLGGHVDVCDGCGHTAISYNSCRNRHCPKCQGATRMAWLHKRESELLHVEYFHVVFTVPNEVADLALINKKCVYEILFKTASQALLRVAENPRYLGARIGFLAVLHTWGQTLVHHPHVHCVVPGGGLSKDGSRWVSTLRPGFLLPVRVLSSLFRGLFTAELDCAFRAGHLIFPPSLSHLSTPAAFDLLLGRLRSISWVVYAKPPFGGPQQVLRYLGRYTHRVAISNDRILAADDGKVSFGYKDYRQGNHLEVMTLDATEFIRRFLMHVLPARFHRIRQFGFLANRSRKRSLALCRRLISEAAVTPAPPPPPPPLDPLPTPQSATPGIEPAYRHCPACHGPLRRLELPPDPACPVFVSAPPMTAPSRASPSLASAA